MSKFAVKKGFEHQLRELLAARLPEFLVKQRWFGGKARKIRSTEIADIIPMRYGDSAFCVLIVTVNYSEGSSETYSLPVLCLERSSSSADDQTILLNLRGENGEPLLEVADATRNDGFLRALLDAINNEATFQGEQGEFRGFRSKQFAGLDSHPEKKARPKLLTGEQSNTSVIYGERLILKFFRRIEQGINPDLEIGRFLTEKAHFAHIPALAGYLEYGTMSGQPTTQAVLQAFVLNQGDAWRYTLKSLAGFFEKVRRQREQILPERSGEGGERDQNVPEFVQGTVGPYLSAAALLGTRTAELHLALASQMNDPAFTPEPFTADFQQSLLSSLIELASGTFRLLREKLSTLAPQLRKMAERITTREKEIGKCFRSFLHEPIHAMRTRIHGDYHLGQVLYTGTDFVIIDFEGEPARPLAERRMKRSPLQDVAGMMRSFHYAAFAPLVGASGGGDVSPDERQRLEHWAAAWSNWAAGRFLSAYFRTSGPAVYLPQSANETKRLLELHLLEKAVYELGYELNNRPTWVGVPLRGIEQVLSR